MNEEEPHTQKAYIKCCFNGYFFTFFDQMLAVKIVSKNPDYPEKSAFEGISYVFPPINADEEGEVDLTPMLHTLAVLMQEHPKMKFKAYATGFSRKFHFNKELLKTPIPEGFLKMFPREKHE